MERPCNKTMTNCAAICTSLGSNNCASEKFKVILRRQRNKSEIYVRKSESKMSNCERNDSYVRRKMRLDAGKQRVSAMHLAKCTGTTAGSGNKAMDFDVVFRSLRRNARAEADENLSNLPDVGPRRDASTCGD